MAKSPVRGGLPLVPPTQAPPQLPVAAPLLSRASHRQGRSVCSARHKPAVTASQDADVAARTAALLQRLVHLQLDAAPGRVDHQAAAVRQARERAYRCVAVPPDASPRGSSPQPPSLKTRVDTSCPPQRRRQSRRRVAAPERRPRRGGPRVCRATGCRSRRAQHCQVHQRSARL